MPDKNTLVTLAISRHQVLVAPCAPGALPAVAAQNSLAGGGGGVTHLGGAGAVAVGAALPSLSEHGEAPRTGNSYQ